MKYLTAEEILIIHARVIDETGGSHGVREVGLLASLIERPKSRFGGREQYKGIFKKAAVYLNSLIRYHVFVDGNKRTAILASARFLFLNHYNLEATSREVEKFVLKVATKKLDIEKIANWFKAHSKKIKEDKDLGRCGQIWQTMSYERHYISDKNARRRL